MRRRPRILTMKGISLLILPTDGSCREPGKMKLGLEWLLLF